MNGETTRRYVNLIVAIVTILFNGLANALPLNGQSTGEISDRFDVYFVPAGYVFSIWGVIYIGWLAFAIYQLLPAQRDNPRLERIGYLFVVSGIANMAWLFLWHYEYFVLTVLVMFVLLLSLIAIYLRLEIGKVRVTAVERWCVDIPFSLYLGWITVATIANVTAVLHHLQWGGWGIRPELWAIILLAVGVFIAAVMGFLRRDIGYMLVIAWAFVGIAIKHGGVPPVATGAWVASIAVIALIGAVAWVGRRQRPASLSTLLRLI
ncbi:MAG: tryptophan-rich sensory protein [Caldilineaceae bacterium]|nr:tryptophan-rich sensory protein [Caldilineaceae bacterium]